MSNNKVFKDEKTGETKVMRRCSVHEENFPGESEFREFGEFYGEAQTKSSYCKRCMLLHHKVRRERIAREENSEKSLYKSFSEKIINLAKVAIEFDSNEKSIDLFRSESEKLLIELKNALSEQN